MLADKYLEDKTLQLVSKLAFATKVVIPEDDIKQWNVIIRNFLNETSEKIVLNLAEAALKELK
jgi:hypothetical protein